MVIKKLKNGKGSITPFPKMEMAQSHFVQKWKCLHYTLFNLGFKIKPLLTAQALATNEIFQLSHKLYYFVYPTFK